MTRVAVCAGADVSIDLVERSGVLKRELLEFSRQRRYAREFDKVMSAEDVDLAAPTEGRLIRVLDHFVLQHRLWNGQTVVEQFVAACPNLPEAEREMLLGWQDVVEGFFEVDGRDGDALVLGNLIDELRYRVRSNLGPRVFRPLRRGSFVVARLVPVREGWLVSGTMHPLPRNARAEVYATAAEYAVRHPELVFRNPEKLTRGWELQRTERDRFVRFFGTDIVVVPGPQLTNRMREYIAFSRRDVLAALSAHDGDRSDASRSLPEYDFPGDLLQSDSVAIIFDPSEGLRFFAGFAMFEQAFADPTMLSQRQYRRRVLDYLDDDTVSPLPFRRMAERDPDRASYVLGRVLRRTQFDWYRDGEALMRRRKPSYFANPPLPMTLPVGERLAPYLRRG